MRKEPRDERATGEAAAYARGLADALWKGRFPGAWGRLRQFRGYGAADAPTGLETREIGQCGRVCQRCGDALGWTSAFCPRADCPLVFGSKRGVG